MSDEINHLRKTKINREYINHTVVNSGLNGPIKRSSVPWNCSPELLTASPEVAAYPEHTQATESAMLNVNRAASAELGPAVSTHGLPHVGGESGGKGRRD